MSNEKPYPTDEFGRPNGRNYHYRIPVNDSGAYRRAVWALHEMVLYKDRFVTEWKEFSGDKLSYIGLQTHDNKGHLKGLEEYAHSDQWQDLGMHSDIEEYRYYKGGTKVRGTFNVDPQSFQGVSSLEFTTTLDVTPKELEEAYENMGDTWQSIQMTLSWVKNDAMEQAREQIAEKQRNCEHEHVAEGTLTEYCEDCGKEFEEGLEA